MALGLGLGLGLLMGLWMEQLTSSAKSVLHCAKQFPHLITLIMQPRSESRCQSPVSLKFSPSSVFFFNFRFSIELDLPANCQGAGADIDAFAQRACHCCWMLFLCRDNIQHFHALPVRRNKQTNGDNWPTNMVLSTLFGLLQISQNNSRRGTMHGVPHKHTKNY